MLTGSFDCVVEVQLRHLGSSGVNLVPHDLARFAVDVDFCNAVASDSDFDSPNLLASLISLAGLLHVA